MRGKIDPSGYGKKKKQPYSHGQLVGSRTDPEGYEEAIIAQGTCSAVWFEVGRSIAKYLEEWQVFRDESQDAEKESAGMGTPEKRWRNDRYYVMRALEVAQSHCDLQDTVPCMIDAYKAGDLQEFEDTDQWDTATEELEKFMENVMECLAPLAEEYPGWM